MWCSIESGSGSVTLLLVVNHDGHAEPNFLIVISHSGCRSATP